jgi:hypothetical protein
MRATCSRTDYMNLSESGRAAMVADFLSLIETKCPDSEFGYHSFPEP